MEKLINSTKAIIQMKKNSSNNSSIGSGREAPERMKEYWGYQGYGEWR